MTAKLASFLKSLDLALANMPPQARTGWIKWQVRYWQGVHGRQSDEIVSHLNERLVACSGGKRRGAGTKGRACPLVRPRCPDVAMTDRVGRIERAAKWEAIAADGRPTTTTAICRRAWPGLSRFENRHFFSARRAAARFLEPVARSTTGRGRPVLWVPKPELMARIRGEPRQSDSDRQQIIDTL
jgi:hypothetical protein